MAEISYWPGQNRPLALRASIGKIARANPSGAYISMESGDPWWLRYLFFGWAWLMGKPLLLMIVGAIIFAIGLYQAVKPATPATEVSVGQTPKPTPRAAPRPIPDALRGDYDKLLGDLSGVLNRKVRPVYEQTDRIAQTIANPILGPDFADARDRLHGFVPVLDEAYNEIYRQMIPNNELFAERLKYILNFDRPETSPIYILNQKISMVHGGIYQVLAVIAKSEGKLSANEMYGLLRTDAENLLEASQATKKWVAQCNERIKQE